MFKKLWVVLLVVSLVVMMLPSAALAGGVGAQATAGVGGPQQPEVRGQAGVQVQAEGSEVAGLMQNARQRLQELQRSQKQVGAGWQITWQALRDELTRLRQQYRIEAREETRAEIRALFKQVIQMLKEQGKTPEMESLLRDLLSLAPGDPEPYQELGKIFRNRGEKTPKVFCDGNELKPDVPPVIKEGRTLIPVRAITEALGATVRWNEKERTVLISKGDITIQLQVENRVAIVNGTRVELDVPAENISNRVFVPLRFISQALKAKVGYYPEGQVIAITQETAQTQN